MRTFTLPRSAAALAMACLALTACGAPGSADSAPAGSAVSAGPTDDDAELRFMELNSRIAQQCAPDAPSTATPGSSDVPRPEGVPGRGTPSPRYPAGATPPGTPDAEGDIPVDTGDKARPTPDSTQAIRVQEVPLSPLETCTGQAHAKRITDAFKDAGPHEYAQLGDKLTTLGYPAARIHRMPDRSGSLRARLDLRSLGSQLALDITATQAMAVVEAFGAPESEDIDLTQVQRKPALDTPTG
ncbi:hypothetical protein AB0E88_22355 [Streptomyces sp. NPDC028635]|uniref:hypothetical protein n=1 Tax=Streptomyces sp. NPDC028635 TaxID=3154800 RepID=UPI003400BAE1